MLTPLFFIALQLRFPAIRQPLILQFKAAFHCDNVKSNASFPYFFLSSLFFFFSFLNVSFSLVQSKWLEWLIMEWSDKNITFIQVYMYKNLNHYTTLKFLNFNTLQWSVLEIIFLSIIIYDFNPYQSNLFPYHSFSMFLLNHFFVICFYIFFNS